MPFVTLGTPAHSATTGKTATDHHTATVAADLNLADLAERAHASLSAPGSDDHHPSGTLSQAIAGSQAAATASGDVTVEGAGFRPTAVIAFAFNGDDDQSMSMGMGGDDSLSMCNEFFSMGGTVSIQSSETRLMRIADTSVDDGQDCELKEFTADGAILTWTKRSNGQKCDWKIFYLR